MKEHQFLHVWETVTGFISKYNRTAWEVSHTISIFRKGDNDELRLKAENIHRWFQELSATDDVSTFDPGKLSIINQFIAERGAYWFNRASGRSIKTGLSEKEIEGIRESMRRDLPAMDGDFKNCSNW